MIRFVRDHWLIVIPYLFVVAVTFVGFQHIESVRNQDCLKARDGRAVLRQVVIEATTPGGGSVDLTKVPGFDDLDPSVQTYLTNLSNALNRRTDPTTTTVPLRDRLLPLVPEITC